MRRNKISLLGLLPSFLCILAMFLSACGNTTSSPAKAPESQQVFRYPIEAETDFQSIDPALVEQFGDGYAIEMVFTGLVTFDNNGNLKDQLAQSHEISPDGKTYTFHLRPNLKFSDGSKLTAHDVAYSINRALLPATQSQVAPYYLRLIKGASDLASGKISTLIGPNLGLIVPDDNTISIVLSQPAAYFLDTLTYPTSYVVEQSLINKYGTSWTDHLSEGGGDGPFKVKSYVHGKTFDLVPNSNYYGPQPALKELDMPFASDEAAAYTAYKNHQYDWAAVPSPDFQEAQKRSDFYRGPTLGIDYITFNYLAAPFDNINIRKAFALAINKNILANASAQGAVIATNHIVPQGMYGYNSNLKAPDGSTSLTGNQNLAQQLLAQGMREKGYSDTSSLPTLTLSTYSSLNPTYTNVVNEVVNEWKTVLKVNVSENALDSATLSREIAATKGNASLQMWASGWLADYPDPQDWLSNFFGSNGGENFSNYGTTAAQQAVQSELSKADVETDSAKRLSDYNDAEQKVVNDVGWLPLYQSALPVVQNPKLHGYKTTALQMTDPDSWSNVYFTT